MHKVINHKLFEIFFEKALIALIIAFAGHVANLSIERFKLVEFQRVAGTAAFVDACQEIWIKVYEYEAEVNKSEDFTIRAKFAAVFKNNSNNEFPEIVKSKKQSDEKLRELINIVNTKRFIIGQQFADHFLKYAGIVKARADAKSESILKFDAEAKIARDAVYAFDSQIASMRFTADMAREYAISRLPR
jgi:hypothetical protein